MNVEKFESRGELPPTTTLTPPPVESFLKPEQASEAWPAEIATNETFLAQLESRQKLNQNLDNVLDSLPQPNMSLEEAINQGHVTEEQVTQLYTSLNTLLENDSEYGRIALYLPFEFLPQKTWHPANEQLQQATDQFRSSYMETWKKLLNVHDVRANFVDGDVLEVEQRVGDLPRVVKAAHLIPKLVEHGLMTAQDVITLLEESEDQTLKDSIADTLPVMADLQLITEQDFEYMATSKDEVLRAFAHTNASLIERNDQPHELAPMSLTLSSLQEKLREEFARVDDEELGAVTTKRAKWLRQKKKQDIIEAAGENVGAAIARQELPTDVVATFLTPEADVTSQHVLINGIRSGIEATAATDPQRAAALYKQYKDTLETLWQNDAPEIKDSLIKTFYRLHRLNIVNDTQLDELHITTPTLGGPFSENLSAMKDEIEKTQDVISTIESNPELSQHIYPIAILYGSRLKGYGAQTADIDRAVFIKPDTLPEKREKITTLLHEAFGEDVAQFWLKESGGELAVHDFDEANPFLGDSTATHVLFGGAWEGRKEVIKELREKLLVPYMYDTNKIVEGRPAHGAYIEELERDTLQYRLMHKGYERFFPSSGGIHTPNADKIDGHSMFWDSGYRQLATKLFASRVFLPKIPAPEK